MADYNPSTWEAEVGETHVQGQTRIHTVMVNTANLREF